MFRYVPGAISLDDVGHDPRAKTLSIKNKSVKQRSIAWEWQVAVVSFWFWLFVLLACFAVIQTVGKLVWCISLVLMFKLFTIIS